MDAKLRIKNYLKQLADLCENYLAEVMENFPFKAKGLTKKDILLLVVLILYEFLLLREALLRGALIGEWM